MVVSAADSPPAPQRSADLQRQRDPRLLLPGPLHSCAADKLLLVPVSAVPFLLVTCPGTSYSHFGPVLVRVLWASLSIP